MFVVHASGTDEVVHAAVGDDEWWVQPIGGDFEMVVVICHECSDIWSPHEGVDCRGVGIHKDDAGEEGLHDALAFAFHHLDDAVEWHVASDGAAVEYGAGFGYPAVGGAYDVPSQGLYSIALSYGDRR